MKLIQITLIPSAAALLLVGCAGQHQQGAQAQGAKKHMPKDPKAKAAMMECLDTVAKGENGRPDRTAMQTCMKEKGFERPEGKKKH
ncbi:MAG: Unknown protein [uncultured Sulfurovum sp.]|uniref:Uncharacterized protein n=1 Tax=uncultured Sulfurovum sp. TaxID=269237 RepID=A0A6S6SEC3_9BACT|nr:MAG: Unknown protein [uncultured Sulfurovum sp.]